MSPFPIRKKNELIKCTEQKLMVLLKAIKRQCTYIEHWVEKNDTLGECNFNCSNDIGFYFIYLFIPPHPTPQKNHWFLVYQKIIAMNSNQITHDIFYIYTINGVHLIFNINTRIQRSSNEDRRYIRKHLGISRYQCTYNDKCLKSQIHFKTNKIKTHRKK